MSACARRHLGATLATARCLANHPPDELASSGLRPRCFAGAPRPLVRLSLIDVAGAPFHIAVFCKPVVPGTVKTRLIPAYGAEGAARIYAQLADRCLRTVQLACATGSATASLWVAGDVSHPTVADWSNRISLPAFAQCEGDLGARMFDCLSRLAISHGRVLLVGTDCPLLDVDHLLAAADLLTPDCAWVFTPAEDGGYVLVGSNRPAPEPFINIAWSSAQVMAQTRTAMSNRSLRWAETKTLWDVDDPADVERACNAGLVDKP